jgi:hypothetical protein
VLFRATLTGADAKGTNKIGLWLGDLAHGARPLARAGDPATDAAGNPLQNVTWKSFPSYAMSSGSNSGPIFIAQLTGNAVTSKDKLGLWGLDSEANVRLLLRTNAKLNVGGVDKAVASFSLLNAPAGSFGARRSYNSTGSIALLATLTDKKQALVRIDIP